MFNRISFVLLIGILLSCGPYYTATKRTSVDDIAGNDDVRRYLKAFQGRGIQSDHSVPTPAKEALKQFKIAPDLNIELLLSEPTIRQPVEMNFDHRGRLWVVQYMQYPYPKGVKVIDIDNHLRAVFDRIPDAPPKGIAGADKISIFEDSNGDGRFDKAVDAISGLNIATSVTLGRGNIWVLTPPYLIAYPDPDGDGIPNGEPEVHIKGFGIEDTHAIANSLRWGPDGWLYGAQGSTTTANIDTQASHNIHFKGQAIWRYHPETRVFEIYAEGGGNTFHLEIDAKGRFYSGTNEALRGYYYKQGGYYKKNWGKHGALTNPFAFGYLRGMPFTGKRIRFTHAWIKYEGGNLPSRYHGKIFAPNPLRNFVQLTGLESAGSSFLTVDEEKVLQTDDHWFRPVDIKAGPDGNIYLADWYDSRLSHVDPRDNWDKNSGRIYRLSRAHTSTENRSNSTPFDLSTYTGAQLIGLLGHPNKWFRQQALRQFGDRKDTSLIPKLIDVFESGDDQTALEALWAIHLSGGFSDAIAISAMSHSDPYVRSWAIRLVGDTRSASAPVYQALNTLAMSETHPEVIGQIASSAKRLQEKQAVWLIDHLLRNEANDSDTDNTLLIWWALEDKAMHHRDEVLTLFKDARLWEKPIVTKVIIARLIKRFLLREGGADFSACLSLLTFATTDKQRQAVLSGIQDGLRNKTTLDIPQKLTELMQRYSPLSSKGKLALPLRQGNTSAINNALSIILDNRVERSERLTYIDIFGEIKERKSIPNLLSIVVNDENPISLRLAGIRALQHFNDAAIGRTLADAYPDKLRANMNVRHRVLTLFSSRVRWSAYFLSKIDKTKEVKKEDVPPHIISAMRLLGDNNIERTLTHLWPGIRVTSAKEKKSEIAKINQALKRDTTNFASGKLVYSKYCGGCHRLYGEGGTLGPDLSGYDRSNLTELVLNIVDPSASIREGYVNYLIKKKDGQVLLGTIKDRSAGSMTIRTMDNTHLDISLDAIDTISAQTQSLMPERLIGTMSQQEIRNLFLYLQWQQ